MRTVPDPTASKKFGRSRLAIESCLLPLFDELPAALARKNELCVDGGWRADDPAEETAVDERLLRPLKEVGRRGLVLLLFLWCREVPM